MTIQKIIILLLIPFIGCTQASQTYRLVSSSSVEVSKASLEATQKIITQRFILQGFTRESLFYKIEKNALVVTTDDVPEDIAKDLLSTNGTMNVVELYKRAELQKSLDRATRDIPANLEGSVVELAVLLNLEKLSNAEVANESITFGLIAPEHRASVVNYFNDIRVNRLFPKNIQLTWSYQPIQLDGSVYYALYFTKIREDLPLNRVDLKSAKLIENFQSTTGKSFELSFSEEGATRLEALSKRSFYKELGATIDGKLIMVRPIRKILTQGVLTSLGDDDIVLLETFSAILNTAAFPITLKLE